MDSPHLSNSLVILERNDRSLFDFWVFPQPSASFASPPLTGGQPLRLFARVGLSSLRRGPAWWTPCPQNLKSASLFSSRTIRTSAGPLMKDGSSSLLSYRDKPAVILREANNFRRVAHTSAGTVNRTVQTLGGGGGISPVTAAATNRSWHASQKAPQCGLSGAAHVHTSHSAHSALRVQWLYGNKHGHQQPRAC